MGGWYQWEKEGLLCVPLITVLTFLSLDYVSPRHPYQLPSEASPRPFTHGPVQQNSLQQNLKEKRKKKHISQVQGGQTLTYVPHIRTGYRYERINLRNLSFHVRSAYVYALVWHMSHFSYNLWVTRGIRPILIELDIYFLLLKAQSLPKKKQESVENFYLYQIEQKGTFPPGISPPFFLFLLSSFV